MAHSLVRETLESEYESHRCRLSGRRIGCAAIVITVTEYTDIDSGQSGLDDQILLLDRNGKPMKLRSLRDAFVQGRLAPRRTERNECVADQVDQPSGFFVTTESGKQFVRRDKSQPVCFLVTENAFNYMTAITLELARLAAEEAAESTDAS
jgi:hypothetical protein